MKIFGKGASRSYTFGTLFERCACQEQRAILCGLFKDACIVEQDFDLAGVYRDLQRRYEAPQLHGGMSPAARRGKAKARAS